MAISKKLPVPTIPSQISHYTTLDGFKGIVESRSLWASNASFLNDKAELQHALDVSEKVISMISSHKGVEDWSPIIKKVFKSLADGTKPDTYVACFCKDDDNLSQWRGYSGSEQGICITFDREKIAQRLKNDKPTFVQVKYSKFSTASKVADMLNGELRKIADIGDIFGDISERERYKIMYSRVSKILPVFKHLGFKDEREWRFIFQKKVGPEELQFRVNKNKIVPYIVVGKSQDRLPIRSVRIGPGLDQSLTNNSVEIFLKSFGYDVDVKNSDVPFRV